MKESEKTNQSDRLKLSTGSHLQEENMKEEGKKLNTEKRAP